MAVELATGYVTIVPSATGLAGNLSSLLGGPAAAAGATAGQKAGAGISGGIASNTSNVGKTLNKSVVLPIIAIGAAAVASSIQVEDANNTIIRTTGATGKAAEGLKQSFQNVAGQTPADFKTVAAALAEVSQRTGLTGKDLEQLTLQTITFNRISGQTPLVVSDLTRALSAFNIPAKDMGAQLDNLFKVSQKTGVPVQDLVATLTTAGPVLRGLHIPLSTSAGLLAQLDKAGISTSSILPGLRKAFVGFAKDGKAPAQGLQDTLGAMEKLIAKGDTLGANALAIKVFGARGTGLVDAAASGKLKLDDLSKSFATSGKGILDTASATGTFAGKMGVLKNNVELAFAQIGKPILETLTATFKELLPIITGVIKAFLGLKGLSTVVAVILAAVVAWKSYVVVAKVVEVVQALLNGTMDANPIGLIVIAVAALVAGFILLYNNVSFVRDALDFLWGVLQTVAAFIVDNWPFVFAILTGGMSLVAAFIIDHWDTIQRVFVTAFDFIAGVVETGMNIVTTVISFALGVVRSIFDTFAGAFKGAWSGLWDGLSAVVSAVAGPIGAAFDAVIGVVRRVYNAVRNFWNGIHIDLPSIDTHIPGIGEIGGGSIDPPNLPPFPLGSGGIVRARPGGTVTRLAERGQDEAVIPLPRALSSLGVGQAAVVVNFNGLMTDPASAGREVDRVLRKYRGSR